MASGRDGAVLGSIRTLFGAGTSVGMDDAQLLDRFLAGRDEDAGAAFEALVTRHGPMVLGVCRNARLDAHEAQDAFQATFLVLARRAGTIRRRDSLASWLFGVARKVATRAKSDAALRRVRERGAAVSEVVETDPAREPEDLSALYEEIDRLPGTYRDPVILCYLDGMTYEAAARQLRCPLGTLSVRLKRARERLRSRLARRGVAHSALPIGGLIPGATTASVPIALAESAVRAAIPAATVKSIPIGMVSASVSLMSERMVMTMFWCRWKAIATLVLALGIVATGAGLIRRAAFASGQPVPGQAAGREVPGKVADPPVGDGGPTQPPDAPKGGPGGPGVGQGGGSRVDEALARVAPGRIVGASPVTKDCMTLSYLPDWSHGEVDNLAVANNGGGVRTLLDWGDPPSRDAGPADRRFFVALYSRRTTSGGPAGPLHAFLVEEDWAENTSWKSKPGYEPEPVGTYRFEPGEGWKLFDVTAAFRGPGRTGGSGRGLLLRFLGEDRPSRDGKWSGYQFVSREGTGEWVTRRPMLLIVDPSK